MQTKQSISLEKLSNNWLELGKLDQKCVFFLDDIIPIAKRDNDNIYKTGYWIFLNNELYYFKAYNTKEKIIAELLGEEISKYFGLETVSFKLAKGLVDNTFVYGVISRWARKKDSKYITFESFFKNYPSYNSLEFLKILNKEFMGEPIIKEFKTFLVREYITNEYDRMPNEILLEEKDQAISLGYLCDYEVEFFSSSRVIFVPSFYSIDLNRFSVSDMIMDDEVLKNAFQKSLFISYLDILKKLEDEKNLYVEEPIKERIISNYQEKQNEIRLNLSLNL